MKERIKDLVWPVLFILLLVTLFFLPSIAKAEERVTGIVAAGDDHSLYVDENGSLYAWGSNIYGQLGTAEYEEIVYPKQTLPGRKIVAIAAGSRHSLALTDKGELYACGEGALANALEGTETIGGWKLVMKGVKSISAGSLHSLVLTEKGDVYAFGKSNSGALGDGTKTARTKPVKVMTGAVAVEAGGNVSFAIKKNGDLYAWGSGSNGALGTGKTENALKPVRVMRSVASVSTSGRHTLIVKKDGSLYGCGQNDFGQLGSEKGGMVKTPVRIAKKVRSASAGWYGSLVITKSGDLYGCGQIGIPKLYSEERAMKRFDGEISHGYDLTKLTKLASKVKTVQFGDYHALFITDDGSVYAFGGNSWAQLGRGTYDAVGNIEKVSFEEKETGIDNVPEQLRTLGKLQELTLVEKWGKLTGEHRVYRFKMLDGTRGTAFCYEREEDFIADWKAEKLSFAHTEELMIDPLSGEASGHGAEFILPDGKTIVTLDESMPAAVTRVRALAAREGWKNPYDGQLVVCK
ncbi:MAG: RCC1 domain-containing protein [Christensenellales bacterium]|jgi:alpha-tubulin suppressor-like RCC1 family protein